ncbi:MAG: phytanoyl-CoA dioxygenase family protein [Lentisphaeria bacterium]|nr:phytanoyl-CoA dioxygenase family protein [Lentisphaeria bacterium]NQZ70117.1 phytanoyl-CoA dioxygenase family protein [Lentisphaeria bacterium]
MLNKEQIEFYEQNGYLILRKLIPEDEIAEMRQELFEIIAKPWEGSCKISIPYENEHAGKDPLNPLGAYFVIASQLLGDRWVKLCMDERFVMPMVDLLGPNINLHDQKIPMKPPGHVSDQRWHQDWVYERHDRPDLAAVLLYLDETKPGSGATKIAPGTHLKGEIPHDRESNQISIEDDIIGDNWLQPEMNPGDAIIIHTHLAHSVGDNLSDETKALVAHVYKTAEAIDTHGNNRQLAELPVARNGKMAFEAKW